ncbi:MAG: cupin domain-containing protein [Promethearchaeota archaeon]
MPFDNPVNQAEVTAVEMLPGIVRKTLAHNGDLMVVRFDMKAGARIELHSHAPSQNGYVVSGRIKFFTEGNARDFVAGPGDGYCFDPHEKHGADILEDAVVIEAFSPARPEYVAP